jgi:RND family efflux transporter MFP subunit
MSKTSTTSNKRRSRWVFITVVLILIIGGVVGFVFIHNKKPAAAAASSRGALQQVAVASVSSLSPNNAPLSVIGTVSSEDDATILAQSAGQIVSLDKQLGDRVSAGDVIATLDNSSQQAAVLQAQGAYASAQAALATDEVTLGNASTSLANTQSQQATAVQNAEITLLNSSIAAIPGPNNDSITATISGTYTGTQQGAYNLSLYSTGDGLDFQTQGLESANGDVRNQPVPLGSKGLYIQFSSTDVSPSDTWTINIPNTDASAYVTNSNAYQAALQTSNSQISTAQSAVASAQAALQQAQANEEEQLGALNVAKAALQKTIIQSPISGTIIDLPVNNGDDLSASEEVAEVSNPNALKVVAYITPDDAQTLSVGNKAAINQTINGVITSIAQDIDPKTGAIEVEVGLPDNASGLTDGDSVTVDMDRAASLPSTEISTTTAGTIIPIVALKITPTGPVVFSVDKTTKSLVSHPVQIGSILGANIVVLSGLSPDMVIVTDARGLTSGEKVSIKQ